MGNNGNHPSICSRTQGNQEKPVSRWPVAGPYEKFLKIEPQSAWSRHCEVTLSASGQEIAFVRLSGFHHTELQLLK